MADSPGILRFGIFEVNLTTEELRKNGSRVKLQEQPLQVLVTLLKRPGEIVSKEELKEKLWADDTFVDFDHSLSTAVNKIREALGDSATSPRFIETVPRKGYRFVGAAATPHVDSAKVSAETASASSPGRRWGAWGLAAAASIALIVFGLSRWQYRSPPRNDSVPAAPIPLTSLRGSEERPAFSPDGTRVAYSWSGESGDNVDIYVQVVGSSNMLRLTTDAAIDEAPSWSPDGRQIAFVRTFDTGQAIYLTSPVGGPERKVTEFSDPSVVTERSVFGRPAKVAWGGLAWTPDGKSILFCEPQSPGGRPAIYRFFLETGEKQRLTSPPAWTGSGGDAFPAVSPDGQSFAFARGTNFRKEINVASLAGGEPLELTSQGEVTLGLAWAADGLEIVYAKASVQTGAFGRLWRISASGGEPHPVPEAGQGIRYPAISHQGDRLVYERPSFNGNVWLYPLPGAGTGQASRQIIASTYDDREPRISPEGNRIVFSSNRTGHFEIWVSDRDGSNLTQVTSLRGWAGSPRWSPDGHRIAFDSNHRGNGEIFVIDAQGGPSRRITSDPSLDARPSWSRDGGWIYFTSQRDGTLQIWKVSSEGGEPIQITHGGGGQPFESADGRFVYFNRGNSGVWRVPVEGGEETPVLPANTAAWAVAKDGLYFVEPRERPTEEWFLRLLRFDATEPADVMQVPPPWWASALDIAPDGKWFVYTQSEQVGSDLMLVENFE
jgi:Tol biopolymer transport system component/DNA-binding winged helix-turn-helix (wHTH) protein